MSAIARVKLYVTGEPHSLEERKAILLGDHEWLGDSRTFWWEVPLDVPIIKAGVCVELANSAETRKEIEKAYLDGVRTGLEYRRF